MNTDKNMGKARGEMGRVGGLVQGGNRGKRETSIIVSTIKII